MGAARQLLELTRVVDNTVRSQRTLAARVGQHHGLALRMCLLHQFSGQSESGVALVVSGGFVVVQTVLS